MSSQPDRGRGWLSIGEVLSRLQADFPDLSLSKLRFLESIGLIEPRRTASGYRKFTEADVETLRLILVLQRDHYMPHKAIKEYLDARESGSQLPQLPGEAASNRSVEVEPSRLAPNRQQARLRPAELAASADIDLKLVASLESFGLIKSSEVGYYNADDVEIAELAGRLAEYGIEPRHLRMFRTAADREISIIETVTTPTRHHRGSGAAAAADDMAREIATVCLQLHAAMVRSALTRLN